MTSVRESTHILCKGGFHDRVKQASVTSFGMSVWTVSEPAGRPAIYLSGIHELLNDGHDRLAHFAL
jgi:hypothetical protein